MDTPTSRHGEIAARIELEQICIVTGHVLDPSTAVALYDRTGEVLVAVLSPQAWLQIGAGLTERVPEAIVLHGSNTFELSMEMVKD